MALTANNEEQSDEKIEVATSHWPTNEELRNQLPQLAASPTQEEGTTNQRRRSGISQTYRTPLDASEPLCRVQQD